MALARSPTPGGRKRRLREQGALLILVLAVLTITSLLGIVFVTFQKTEQLVSRSYSDDVRASFLAQAGLQHALAALGRPDSLIRYESVGGLDQPRPNPAPVYFGVDPTVPNAVPRPALPLEWAAGPSFRVRDATGNFVPPYLVEPLDGPLAAQYLTAAGTPDTGARAASGFMEMGRYGSRTEVYALRLRDESSVPNANDGVEFGPNHAVSRNLRRILNTLGQALAPQVPTLGDRVVLNRPASGYRDAPELRDTLLSTGLSAAQAQAAASHLTVDSWKDSSVANPVPLSNAVASPTGYPNAYYAVTYVRPTFNFGSPVGTAPVMRLGYDRDFNDHPSYPVPPKPDLRFYEPSLALSSPFHNGIYDHRSVHPLWVEVVKRAPVNVNTAPRPVLVALLHGLQGFFASIERRRDRPVSSAGSDSYGWMRHHLSYDPGGSYPTPESTADGDECGFLYTTMRYWDESDPAWDPSSMVGARLVADEIIACRERTACAQVHAASGTTLPPGHPTTDYSGDADPCPFAGPFRSWAQFHAFVDHLVNAGVLAEKRTGWFFDYYPNGTPRPGGSAVQLRLASEALGDVLKANFNPNLHLNELNPNRNLYLHVDKTDLLVNSTEFCFLPVNGAFTVESLGRVLAPPDGELGADPFTSGLAFQVMAEKKLRAMVQVWDGVVRHTQQAQFYAGTFGPRQSPTPETNNNFAVETGPEVDNGPITSQGMDAQTRWDGYVQLSTYGGNHHDGTTKPKNDYRVTMSDAAQGIYAGIVETGRAAQLGAKIHSHFTYDGSAHFHRSEFDSAFAQGKSFVLPIGPWMIKVPVAGSLSGGILDKGFATVQINLKARAETHPGGYFPPDHVYQPPAHRYRSARSFTIGNPDGPPGAWNPANAYAFPVAYHAPTDLRVDGIYLQRGSSMGYAQVDWEAWQNTFGNAANIARSSFRFHEGTASFWLKPNWFPECTGKPRTLLSVARPRYHILNANSGG